MRVFIFLITSILIHTVQAGTLTNKRISQINSLIKKGYCFVSSKDEKFELLNSKSRKQVSTDEFLSNKKFECINEISRKKILALIIYRYKQDFKILFRKKVKVYHIKDGRFAKFDINRIDKEKSRKLEKITKKEQQDFLLDITQCSFCQFKLSANFVKVSDKSQYSGEVSWVPYYKINQKSGLAFSFGAASYSIENKDLKEEVSYAIKYQVLYRYYFDSTFIEAGGGQHDFIYYTDSSSIVTAGIGHIFDKRYWFLSKAVGLNGIFFHVSKINWRIDITEFKFGIGINF